jgi:hypothetical protein
MLALAAALVFGLSSCDFNLVGDYTFEFNYEIDLADKDAANQVKNYLKDFVALDGTRGTFHGSYGEAADWALGLYYQGCMLMNYELVAAYIVEETDVIRVNGWMTGPKTNEIIGRLTWDYDSLHGQNPANYGY